MLAKFSVSVTTTVVTKSGATSGKNFAIITAFPFPAFQIFFKENIQIVIQLLLNFTHWSQALIHGLVEQRQLAIT